MEPYDHWQEYCREDPAWIFNFRYSGRQPQVLNLPSTINGSFGLAGVTFKPRCGSVVANMVAGRPVQILAVREPNNQYDPNAIRIDARVKGLLFGWKLWSAGMIPADVAAELVDAPAWDVDWLAAKYDETGNRHAVRMVLLDRSV